MIASKLHLRRLYAFPAVFLLIFTIAVFRYVQKYFVDVNLGQILFFINTSAKGADTHFVSLFIQHCIITPSLYALAICYLPMLNFWHFKCKVGYNTFISLLSLILIIGYIFYKTDSETLRHFFSNERTDFYERYYTEPREVEIQIPQKKNLIILHIESLEETFENQEFFGTNLLADLREFEEENVQFKNFHDGYATDFTQGSVMALFTGMPVKYHNLVNKFGKENHFFKGYYSLGKILKDNGYVLSSVQGTDSNFGGMKIFLQDNDFTDMVDMNTIKKNYPQYEQKGTWGYTDDVVLEVAKDRVDYLSRQKPYFLYVQTIDTHVGHKPEVKKYPQYDNIYYNIIHHTELHIADFLKWLQERPDYKDTVILVMGDHLRMGNDFPMPNERRVYNLFINTPQPQNVNRTFTQVDMFPTVIEALGGKIKNHRLGIGTSLFSEEPTFSEVYSEEFLRDTLAKRNKLYEKKFMQ